MKRRGIEGCGILGALGLVAGGAIACGVTAPEGEGRATAPAVTSGATATESARVQAFLDARYKASDVTHSFKTKAGETIDCVDFFAQPGAKQMAALGKPVTHVPAPPSPKGARPATKKTDGPLSEYLFLGTLDEDGNARQCAGQTVPLLRITASEIAAAGGLDAYEQRLRDRPPPVHPPRRQAASTPGTKPVEALGAVVGRSSRGASERPASPPPPTHDPVPGWCVENAAQDITGYAHVIQTLYPAETGTFDFGGGNFSIYEPSLTSTNVSNADHSLMEMWVYSGWGFDDFGCSCTTDVSQQSLTNPPCAESVEVGWDVAPSQFNGNAPHLFTFSTNDGYAGGCYDGASGSGCPTWMVYPGATMTPGASLNSVTSTVGGTTYELKVEVQWNTLESAWFVGTGVCQVDSDGVCDILANGADQVTWQGTYEGSTFSGPMASGEAQTVQFGGEVNQNEGGKWNVPMGSGKAPSAGLHSAAYVTAEAAYPTAEDGSGNIGPVTVPTVYTYSTKATPVPPGGTAAQGSYFYLGDGTDGYTWAQVSIAGAPAIFNPGLPVAIGANTQTIAPIYVYAPNQQTEYLKIYALTTANGLNHAVQKFDWTTNVWTTVKDANGNPLYLYGLTTDNASDSGAVYQQAFWGWTYFAGNSAWGSVYTGETGGILAPWGQTATSVAAASETNIVATSNSSTCPALDGGNPEPCILQFVPSGAFPGGSWKPGPGGAFGAEQVAFDAMNATLYALDATGSVWSWTGTTWRELMVSPSECDGTAGPTIAYVVAKNGVVYGLGVHGSVWFYTHANGCWTQVGSRSDFAVSIATDNSPNTGVWATDTSGNIWVAD